MEDEEYLYLNNPAVTHTAVYRLETGASSRHGPAKRSISRTPSSGQTETTPDDCAVESQSVISKHDRGWRRVVRNFSPSWFSVTMGTGVVAELLFTMPFSASWLYWLSVVVFAFNAFLFALAFLASFVRYTFYPEIWGVMIRDPTNSLFLGTIPMGFATLVQMWVLVCVPPWGPWAVTFGWICWMVDVVVAVTVTVSLNFNLISQDEQMSLERITAAQLLPIAATIVAAGTGALAAEVLPNPQHALGTIITCYVVWGMGLPLAITVLVMYYQRLAIHKLPAREVIVSCFLPLGPLSFGGFTIMYLGYVAKKVFPETGSIHPLAGPIAYVFGFFVGLIMWGFAVVWLILALATIYKCKPIPFNMGWWGFVFPLGVFADLTNQIGKELPSEAFKVLGTIASVAVILLWMVVAAGTAKGAWSGQLFYAPCLRNLKPKDDSTPIVKTQQTVTSISEHKSTQA